MSLEEAVKAAPTLIDELTSKINNRNLQRAVSEGGGFDIPVLEKLLRLIRHSLFGRKGPDRMKTMKASPDDEEPSNLDEDAMYQESKRAKKFPM